MQRGCLTQSNLANEWYEQDVNLCFLAPKSKSSLYWMWPTCSQKHEILFSIGTKTIIFQQDGHQRMSDTNKRHQTNKSSCTAKKTTNKMKRQPTTWKYLQIKIANFAFQMQIKTIIWYHLTTRRMTIVKKTKDEKFWPGCEENRTLVHYWRECKLV